MSLYDEAVLIQKPSGYKAEKLYNVIPSPEVSEQSSLEFDGVDDCLITDGDSVAQPTTYSFWAKSTETGGNTGVFGHGGTSIGAFHFNYGSKPLLYLGSGYYRYWADISEQDDGEWHHWVVYSDTNDITNSKLYVDGVLQDASTTSTGSTFAYTEGLTIGSDRQSGGNYFEGSISDFAVFSRELSAADVKEIYNYGSPNDLLLPASYGTDISQSSTKSVEFDGVDDYAATTSSFQSAFRDSFTISFWVKCDDGQPSAEISILGTRNSTSEDWVHCNQQTDGDITFYYKSNNNAAEARTSSVVFGDGNTEWFYITLVADNTAEQLKIYVNGVSIAVSGGGLSSVTMSDWTSSDDLFLGARNNNGSAEKFFSGSIDNVGIYNKALTQAEVTRQYNGGQPIDLSTDKASDSLVAYYKMGDGTLDEYPLIADQTDATLGSELVTNGTFDTDASGWGSDSGAAVDWQSDSTLLVGNDGGDNTYATTQTSVLVSGKTYKVSFRFKPSGSGTLRVRLGGSGTTFTTESFVVDAWNDVEFFGTADNTTLEIGSVGGNITNFYLDNVSVKQVQGNPAAMTNMSSTDITTDVALSVVNDLDLYYQMGDGILDEYPVIADQTNATLGSELSPNYSCDDNITGWSGYNSTVSHETTITYGSSSGSLKSVLDGGNSWIAKSTSDISGLSEGDIVKATAKVYIPSGWDGGDIWFQGASWSGRTEWYTRTSASITDEWQDVTYYAKLGSDVTGPIYLRCVVSSSAGMVIYFDNISIKAYNGNPATMTNMSSADIVAWTPDLETDFDVARSSTTTRINASGYIEDVAANVPRLNYDSGDSCPYLLTEAASTNLITYPKSFGNNYWTKSGATIEGDSSTAGSEMVTGTDADFSGAGNWVDNGTTTTFNVNSTIAGEAYIDFDNTGNSRIKLPTTFTSGLIYLVSVDITVQSGTPTSIQMGSNFGLDADGSFNILPTGSKVTYTGQINANATSLYIGGVNVGDMTISVDNVSVKEVQGFEAPKVDGNGDLEREAFKLVENTEYNDHFLRKASISITSGNVYTLSIYAKKGERTWMAIRSHTPTEYTWFDLDNGTIGTTSSEHTATITPIANGWYRCSVTYTEDNTDARAWFYAATEDNVVTYTGDGTSGIYIAYAQLEESDYASSLMLPVSEGSTTSRVADAITNAGNQSLFSGVNSSGTLYAEIAINSDDLTGKTISLTDGSSTNRIYIYYTTLSNTWRAFISVGGVSQASLDHSVADITDFSKVGFRWAENDFSLWVDGVEVDTDTSGSAFPASTLSTLRFDDSSAENFYGKTKALAVFDYLSDDEMETLTT